MADSGELEVDMLFLGLTRPPLLFGVDYMVVIMNFLGNMVVFLLFTTFYIVPSMVVIHGIAYLVSQREPRFIQLLLTKGQKCRKVRNFWFHGNNNSYDVT